MTCHLITQGGVAAAGVCVQQTTTCPSCDRSVFVPQDAPIFTCACGQTINAKAAKASGTTNSLAANSIHRASIENRPTDKSMEIIVYEAFCRADTDRDGYIDGNEMRLLLTSLYFPPKFIEEELQAFGSGGRKPLNWAAFGNYYTLLQERTLALTVTPNT